MATALQAQTVDSEHFGLETEMSMYVSYQDGAQKFWAYLLIGNVVLYWYGPLEQNGQTQTKMFTYEHQARAHAENKLRKKMRSGGYRHVFSDEVSIPTIYEFLLEAEGRQIIDAEDLLESIVVHYNGRDPRPARR